MHYLLFTLFFVLFTSRVLGFDLSLAPGLSVKNGFLYLIFFALAVETALTRRRKLELLSVITPFVIYVGYAIFSWVVILLVMKYPGYSPIRTAMTLKAGPIENLMVLLIFFYGVSDAQRAIWLLRSIVWLVIVGNVVTVIDMLNIPDLGLIGEKSDEAGRTVGPIGNANEYASFLALFLPGIAVIYWNASGFKKLLAGIGGFLSGIAFLMAVSRGAVVGLLVGGVVGAIYLRDNIPPRILMRAAFAILLLSVVVVIGAFAVGYGDLLIHRFGILESSGYEASSGRTMIWGRALDKMLDYPVSFATGFGWYAYESSRNFTFATHNSYLNILFNLGMIGVSLFGLIAANVLRVARIGLRRASSESRSWLIALVFGFLALLVSIFFGELHQPWLYIWAYVGITLRLAIAETGNQPADTRRASIRVAKKIDTAPI
ncbi:MAG: O-antigen ligase family protein [Woeseiaceae bacterium]|nr:O-antigen ligase family protein [Woeseiaceae bacterium]